jgi:hypothetical protein
MKRFVLTGAVMAALFASAGGAVIGCGLVVGSGDYSVGHSGDGGLVGEGGMMMLSEGGTSDGPHVTTDGPTLGLVGDPCAVNSDCAAALRDVDAGATCNGTTCTETCKTSASCGSNSAGTPNVCVQNVCFPGCTTTAGCAAYAGTSCQELVAGAGMVCAQAPVTGSGMIGDPCATNSDCAVGSCNGTWCGETCAPATGCGSNSFGTPNYCVKDSNNADICFPGCTSSADCAFFAGTLTCQAQPGGMSICAVPAGNIGDPCTTASDCKQGSCMTGIPWCTASCTSTSSTCGSNSSGEPNYCVENAANAFICFPGCTTNTDCDAYSGTTCQLIATGGTQSICSAPSTSNGFIGDPCTTSSDCTEGSCESGIVWCTESCTQDSDCQGTDSAGNPTYCVENGNSQFICFPGCTTDTDCSVYNTSTLTLTCQTIGTEPGSICSTSP